MAIKREDERHRYGRHYTPEPVASLLAAFAIRSAGDFVLDPSCGDGRLIKASLDAKRLLSRQDGRTESQKSAAFGRQVFGLELMKSAAEYASRYEAQIAVADFFNVRPGGKIDRGFSLPSSFDAIIGNPPYIRQEIIGSQKKAQVLELLSKSGLWTRAEEGARGRVEEFRQDANLPKRRCSEARPRKWSSRSDIYVYFFAHAERFLRTGGRLVFITASSWLDVGYGLELRQFLLDHFRIIAIIESAAESFFEDASVNTAITVLEKEDDLANRNGNKVRFVQLRRSLNQIASVNRLVDSLSFAREIEAAGHSRTDRSVRLRVVSQGQLSGPQKDEVKPGTPRARRNGAPPPCSRRSSPGDRGATNNAPSRTQTWGRYLRASDVFFRILDRACANLRKLEDVATVRYGVKTGANDFFYVKEADVRSNSSVRKLTELAKVRRGVTTGANEFFYLRKLTGERGPTDKSGLPHFPEDHCSAKDPGVRSRIDRDSGKISDPQSVRRSLISSVVDGAGREFEIEESFLIPILFSLKEIPRILIENSQGTRFLFNCSLDRSSLDDTAAIKYIEAAEAEGIHLRPTCRARTPWYSAIRGIKPAPLIFPSKVGERWVVAINKAGVFEDKKLYGVFPALAVRLELLAALLNSTWARYYVEATCRQLTGAQAIADIDVAVAEQILLPDPTAIDPQMESEMVSALAAISGRDVKSILREVHREDRRTLDDLVLQALGFREGPERAKVLDEMYHAVTELVTDRLLRSNGHRMFLDKDQ